MIIVPGADREIGVLARHAPLIATLKAGSTRMHRGDGGEVLEFATGPGFFQVLHDRAIALVDDAVDASKIDDGPRAGAARGGSGRARGDRTRRFDRRPLAGRAAHPARREPARRRRPRLAEAARTVSALMSRADSVPARCDLTSCIPTSHRRRCHSGVRPRRCLRRAFPLLFCYPESFERQLGDRVNKRLKSPRAPFRCDVLFRYDRKANAVRRRQRETSQRRSGSSRESGSSCSTARGA